MMMLFFVFIISILSLDACKSGSIDLNPLVRKSGKYYSCKGSVGMKEYGYLLNICDNLPMSCDPHSNYPMYFPSVQMNNKQTICYAGLGDIFTTKVTPIENGVELSYTNGTDGRSTEIKILCDRSVVTNDDVQDNFKFISVTELTFKFETRSIHACNEKEYFTTELYENKTCSDWGMSYYYTTNVCFKLEHDEMYNSYMFRRDEKRYVMEEWVNKDCKGDPDSTISKKLCCKDYESGSVKTDFQDKVMVVPKGGSGEGTYTDSSCKKLKMAFIQGPEGEECVPKECSKGDDDVYYSIIGCEGYQF